jgi:hypothetical protein
MEGFPLSAKDIGVRLPTKDAYYFFFSVVHQRLMPDINACTISHLRQFLSGELKLLKLLDTRSYYFPVALRDDPLISTQSLTKLCAEHLVLRDYVPRDCKDWDFVVKVMATLDCSLLADLDNQLFERHAKRLGYRPTEHA